nr:MAG: hypothetical protein DIU78_15150 [Pseudomonadota bacterium]
MELALALTALIELAQGALRRGGSTLAVPVLEYALGFEPKAVIATSLIVVSVTSAVAAVPLARSRLLSVRTGLGFGASGMIGAFAGGAFARFVPGTLSSTRASTRHAHERALTSRARWLTLLAHDSSAHAYGRRHGRHFDDGAAARCVWMSLDALRVAAGGSEVHLGTAGRRRRPRAREVPNVDVSTQ